MSAPPSGAPPARCAVCGGAALPAELAECADCGARFHLDFGRRGAGRSCGAPTFGAACGFSFGCDRCIEGYGAAAAGRPWRSAVR